jgi:hypothetical protein
MANGKLEEILTETAVTVKTTQDKPALNELIG